MKFEWESAKTLAGAGNLWYELSYLVFYFKGVIGCQVDMIL